MVKLDFLYTNWDYTMFSIHKIKAPHSATGEVEEYLTFKEGIEAKFPGYTIDKNSIVQNISDIELDLK